MTHSLHIINLYNPIDAHAEDLDMSTDRRVEAFVRVLALNKRELQRTYRYPFIAILYQLKC